MTDRVTTIPLDRVLGNGLRGLRALEPDLMVYLDTREKLREFASPDARAGLLVRANLSLVWRIERAMGTLHNQGLAIPGFAVEGTDRSVLWGIHRVLVSRQPPCERFTAGDELSLVFYTRPLTPAVGLDRIEKYSHSFLIRYRLIDHGLPAMRWRLAIIPVGRLPVGEYRINLSGRWSTDRHLSDLRRIDPRFESTANPPVEPEFAARHVCHPFRFDVVGD